MTLRGLMGTNPDAFVESKGINLFCAFLKREFFGAKHLPSKTCKTKLKMKFMSELAKNVTTNFNAENISIRLQILKRAKTKQKYMNFKMRGIIYDQNIEKL